VLTLLIDRLPEHFGTTKNILRKRPQKKFLGLLTNNFFEGLQKASLIAASLQVSRDSRLAHSAKRLVVVVVCLLDAGHTRLKHWAVHVLLFPPSRNVTGLMPYGVVQIFIIKVRIAIHQNGEHIVPFPDC